MKKKEILDIVFILDRSGSMAGLEKDTIGGYNNYIKKFKNKDAKITTILFDDRYEVINKRVDIKDAEDLNEEKYFVRGSTALMDAIGKSIKFMEEESPDKVMFIITTDGYENASASFTKEQIKEMIEGHKSWEFMYIGADIDSYSEGQKLGIKASNIANFKKDRKGVSEMFNAVAKASEEYSCGNSISNSWKENLENYTNEL